MKPRPRPTPQARLLALLGPWVTPLDPSVLLRTFTRQTHPQPGPDAREHVSTWSAGRERTTTPTIRWGTDEAIDGAPDDSILETLEAAGIEPTFGCRRGVCRRCVVPLDAGCVRDRRDERDIEAGTHIRICVTSPLTDIDLDPGSSTTSDRLATSGAAS